MNIDLIQALDALVGKKVTDIIAGSNIGSIFHIGFDKYGKNKAFDLLVRCTWRLSINETIMVSSLDSNKTKIPQSLKKLKNKTLLSYKLKTFNDLEIEFEEGYLLSVFCDISPNYAKKYLGDNWCLSDLKNNKVFIANKFSDIDEDVWE